MADETPDAATAAASGESLADFDTDELAKVVRTLPDDQLREGVEANRDALLAEIFRRFPERITDAGRRESAVIKWKITGAADAADRWFLVLDDGDCRTGRDLDLEPQTTIGLDAVTFVQLVTGNANPVELFLRRRLRVKGDLALATRLTGLFAIPRG